MRGIMMHGEAGVDTFLTTMRLRRAPCADSPGTVSCAPKPRAALPRPSIFDRAASAEPRRCRYASPPVLPVT